MKILLKKKGSDEYLSFGCQSDKYEDNYNVFCVANQQQEKLPIKQITCLQKLQILNLKLFRTTACCP